MWPTVRACIIGVVLLFCAVEALPLPTLKKRHMNRQIALDEADRWVSLLQSVGVDTDRKTLVNEVLSASRVTGAIRNRVIRPWLYFSRSFGLAQRWALFTFTDPNPGRLVITARKTDGKWYTLYRAPETDTTEWATMLQYRRVRGLWDDGGDRPYPGKLYDRWVTWLGARIFENHSEIDAIRVRFDRLTIQPPGSPRTQAAERVASQRERFREDYR